ncbi:UDP-2,3-diacylglucosamine diphosphatase [bacterium]|nr:UDP-2,3-diacylglucosamine diphosphatase [bacterium]
MSELRPGKKIYFISDIHLGTPDYDKSLEREKKLVKWLSGAMADAGEIFLLGDIFDFWFEYKSTVPRGYTRFLGKLAEVTDSGIPVHYFTGNHDLWIFDYLPRETGVTVHRNPIKKIINGKIFMMGHGDGLGPFDPGSKIMKRIFTNRLAQRLFSLIHPDIGIKLARYLSKKSRESLPDEEFSFKGEDRESLVLYAKKILLQEHIDYFIFGHRHIPVVLELNKKSKLINIGDWITYFSYAVFDGKEVGLLQFHPA